MLDQHLMFKRELTLSGLQPIIRSLSHGQLFASLLLKNVPFYNGACFTFLPMEVPQEEIARQGRTGFSSDFLVDVPAELEQCVPLFLSQYIRSHSDRVIVIEDNRRQPGVSCTENRSVLKFKGISYHVIHQATNVNEMRDYLGDAEFYDINASAVVTWPTFRDYIDGKTLLDESTLEMLSKRAELLFAVAFDGMGTIFWQKSMEDD